MAQALTLEQLPTGTADLYVVQQAGAGDTGIGTADELRQLITDGIIPAEGTTFRLEWAA